MDRQARPDDWIEGPSWEAPVQVVTTQELPSHDRVTVTAAHSEQSCAYVLMRDDWSLIRLHRTVSPMSLANVMKTAMSLSKLRQEEATIAPKLSLEPRGEVDERAVRMALRAIQKRVVGLAVDDMEGKQWQTNLRLTVAR